MSNLTVRGEFLLDSGAHTWGTSPIQWALCTSALSPSRQLNTSSEIAAAELSGGTYARLTATAGMSVVENDDADRTDFFTAKLSWPTLGVAAGQPRYLVLIDTTTGGVIGWHDLGGAAPAPNGTAYEVRPDNIDGTGRLFSRGGSARYDRWTEVTDAELDGGIENGSALSEFSYTGSEWDGTLTTGHGTSYNGLSEIAGVSGDFSSVFGASFDASIHAAMLRVRPVETSTGIPRSNRWGYGGCIRASSGNAGLGHFLLDSGAGVPAWLWINHPTLADPLVNALVGDSAITDYPTEMVATYLWDGDGRVCGTGQWDARRNGRRGSEGTGARSTVTGVTETPAALQVVTGIVHSASGAAVAGQRMRWQLFARRIPLAALGSFAL